MNTLENIKTRRSIRKYTEEIISQELFEEIIETVKQAPSWKNNQITRFYLIQNKEVMKQIAKQTTFEWNEKILNNTPNLIVLAYETGKTGYERDGSFSNYKKDSWEMFDAGIVAQTLLLTLHEYGLGSVILGIFNEAIEDLIKMKDNESIACLIPFGYPNQETKETPRKDTKELITIIK